jgi:hypothetical protein
MRLCTCLIELFVQLFWSHALVSHAPVWLLFQPSPFPALLSSQQPPHASSLSQSPSEVWQLLSAPVRFLNLK